MSKPRAFRRVARAEFDDAAEFYERAAGHGAAFTAAVDEVLDRIAGQPDFCPEAYQDVREALVPGYPYAVYYRDEPGRVLILAVYHASRDPAGWQRRA